MVTVDDTTEEIITTGLTFDQFEEVISFLTRIVRTASKLTLLGVKNEG